MEEVKFDPKFTEAIREGEKTATIRYWDEYRLLPGDPFTAIEADSEEIISNERCQDVQERSVGHIVEHGVGGHRDYETTDELIKELKEYYPEADIDEDTILQVPSW